MIAAMGRGLCMAALACVLVGCGDPPPRQEKKLSVPKGESTLDELIKKAEIKPAAPPKPARLEISPGAVDFSAISVGETLTRQLQITNSGETPATIALIHVAGQASAFRLGGSCVSGAELAGNSSCSVDVTFRPAKEGTLDAELVVNHSAAGGSLFATLTGQAAVRPAAPLSRQEPEAMAPNAQASLIYARVRQDGELVVETSAAAVPSQRRLSIDDYAEAGLPGIVSTFPVDRTRVITADRYIPAVLENTINSQIPGRAVAVVERNVYGSAGRTVLIPAGSRVIGRYQSLGKMGEARLGISWTRILCPDGISITIDDQSADVMGRTGLPGDLDTRFFEKYGSSLLTSTIAAAGVWALDGTTTTVSSQLGGTTQSMDSRAAAANRLGNDIDQLGQRMVAENVDIRPVLTVPEGTRLNIIPTDDIWLRDPDRIQAVTRAKGNGRGLAADALTQYLPALMELVGQSPAMQKIAPQTSQQLMQSNLLQQLRDATLAASGSANGPQQTPGGTAPPAAGPSAPAGQSSGFSVRQ